MNLLKCIQCFIFLLLVISPVVGVEDSNLSSKLESLFTTCQDLQNQGILDGEVLIAKGDQILLHLQSADIFSEDHEPQFMIGSVTKQFLAVALLKALDESNSSQKETNRINEIKHSLHQPIVHFLPATASIWGGKMPKWASMVTLHHLLSHTSGLPNYTDCEEYYVSDNQNHRFYESEHPTSSIIELIKNRSLLFLPGSQFSYSNTNYVILAEVIEVLTKKPLSQYLQESLFDPIGMTSTSCPLQGKWGELKKDPKLTWLVPQWQYDRRGDQAHTFSPSHYIDISMAKGSGSIVSTAGDLLKWNLALHKKRGVLSDRLYQLLITKNLDGYAYGIGIEHTPIGLALGHHGQIDTFNTLLTFYPEHDLTILVLSHISHDTDLLDGEFRTLMRKLAKRIPDENMRAEVATQLIYEHYPSLRGHARILSSLTL